MEQTNMKKPFRKQYCVSGILANVDTMQVMPSPLIVSVTRTTYTTLSICWEKSGIQYQIPLDDIIKDLNEHERSN